MMPSNTCLSLMTLLALCLMGLAECYGMTEDTDRLPNALHHIVTRELTREQLLGQLSNSIYSDRVRRNHQHMTDAGYGSRIQAGSKLASSLIAQNIFGSAGPGRRKRPSPSYVYNPINNEFPLYR